MKWHLGEWAKGPVRIERGDTVYLSIVFSWDLDRALRIVLTDLALGKRVIAGGPALFLAGYDRKAGTKRRRFEQAERLFA